jgi:hypothetical protein
MEYTCSASTSNPKLLRARKEKPGSISGMRAAAFIPEGRAVLGEEGALGAEFMPQSYSSSAILSK